MFDRPLSTLALLHQQTTNLIAAESSAFWPGFPPQSTAIVSPLIRVGESTIVRKFSIFVLTVLLTVGAFSAAIAQDALPWTVQPGYGPTTEFTGGHGPLSSGQCIQIELNIQVAPPNLRVFVEAKNEKDRFSREIIPLFSRSIIGDHSICIALTDLGLEDPSSGEVNLGKRFNPDADGISLTGVHIWDGDKKADLVITAFAIVVNPTIATPVPLLGPTVVTVGSWCRINALSTSESKTTDQVIHSVNFLNVDLTTTQTVVLFLQNGTPVWADGNWQYAVSSRGSLSIYEVKQVPADWEDATKWVAFYLSLNGCPD